MSQNRVDANEYSMAPEHYRVRKAAPPDDFILIFAFPKYTTQS
jgi:hypothetical protein